MIVVSFVANGMMHETAIIHRITLLPPASQPSLLSTEWIAAEMETAPTSSSGF
jgi:hypothetical protein